MERKTQPKFNSYFARIKEEIRPT